MKKATFVKSASSVLTRFKNKMLKFDYSNNNSSSELVVFEATGMLVGGAGWRELATSQNIQEVLKHTTLQLRYGKDVQSLVLRSII